MASTMLALIAVTVFSNWDPTRVHYVDRVGNAILVRGPSPINASNAFDLASMTSIIVAQAKAEGGYDLPKPFDLVDFTMLSNLKPSESKELTAEKNFFSAATTKFPTNASKLIPWTVIGDLANPNSYSTAIAKEMALNYESRIDEIPKKIAQLRATLVSVGALPTPTVVYFHCDAGMDRTGEIYGQYQMHYANETYAEVMKFDNSIEGTPPAGRPIHKMSEHGVQWYCLYLRYNGWTSAQCPESSAIPTTPT